MNTSLHASLDWIRLTFWRGAAAASGLANRHRQTIYRFSPMIPLLLAGAGAWIVGRCVGGLLHWVLG